MYKACNIYPTVSYNFVETFYDLVDNNKIS